jgi:spore maturation protein CgeB
MYYRFRDRFHGPIHENRYSTLIAGSKICLGYVSASNMDQYTGRSIEIPACGGFFLGERTEAHQRLYEEGKEAEFFGSHEECVNKIRYYLADDARRAEIARAGHRRCTQSANSCVEVMNDVLRQIMADGARRVSLPSKRA